MKKILSITVLFVAISSLLLAQQVPQGMKYQAVARNLKGDILVNEQIVLRISLTSQQNNATITHYSEMHNVKTNELGLFNLVIGEGASSKSAFKDVPWSSQNIWMEVAIADKAKGGFTVISSSKLLAVPYAFHAETANKISGSFNAANALVGAISVSSATGPTTSGNSWNTVGNYKTNSVTDYVGTADNTDFVVRTNGIERLRFTKGGKLITPGGVGLELGGNLQVKGDSVKMDKDLYVGRNVVLNYLPWDLAPGTTPSGTPIPGKTINRGDFTVSDMSSTILTGSLTVDKLVRFNDATTSTSATTGALVITGGVGIGMKLNVGGVAKMLNSTTSTDATTGALVVTGGVGIGEKLNVGGITKFLNDAQSTTKDDGSLVVEGGVGIERNLNVGGDFDVKGTSSFKAITGESLNISKNTQGYLATFVNTNTDNGPNAGDGIKIQLGKEKALDLGVFQLPEVSTFLPGITGAISNSIFTSGAFNTSLTPETFFNNLYAGATSDVLGYAEILKAGLCKLTNIIVGEVNKGIVAVNDGLSLPYNLATPINTALKLPFDLTKPINDGLNLPVNFAILDIINNAGDVGDLLIPDAATPGPSFTLVPALPSLSIPKIPDLILPAIPTIPTIPDCPPLTNPFNWNLSWPTATSNPLTKNNEFIGFFDNSGAKVGAIRGQSLQDFIAQYTDVPHLVEVASTFINGFDVDAGAPDPFSIVRIGAKAFNYFIQTWDKIGKIGVEYSSGNGDYAEWLERQNPNEVIGTGDIVAVKGGKITKDITGAEQIMAVSHHPIVLGNVPDKEKIQLGNNIAFMGQIPVKVMGPVKAGDYIVAKSDIPGYGVAVDPLNMRVEDYKLAVGRSWTTDAKNGLKMVNTVVGVHNNNFLDLIKELKEKAEENDLRLKAIESKLNISSSDSKINTEKKAFK